MDDSRFNFRLTTILQASLRLSALFLKINYHLTGVSEISSLFHSINYGIIGIPEIIGVIPQD
ncbi:hypothetical protein GCM10009865_08970 [Aeromicrobium ponti]